MGITETKIKHSSIKHAPATVMCQNQEALTGLISAHHHFSVLCPVDRFYIYDPDTVERVEFPLVEFVGIVGIR